MTTGLFPSAVQAVRKTQNNRRQMKAPPKK
jgi:hypothetical protein